MRRISGLAAIVFVFTALTAFAQVKERPIPRFVKKDGRYALFVDDAPYFILGAQTNNSSGWPGVLPKVWTAMEFLHANTALIPVYWEQIEAKQGQYDFSVVDTLPSPFATAAQEADAKAFAALMGHLKVADPVRTVLMVQVENEPGTGGNLRDYSPAAQKLFESPVPADVLKAMNVQSGASSPNWQVVSETHGDPLNAIPRFQGHPVGGGVYKNTPSVPWIEAQPGSGGRGGPGGGAAAGGESQEDQMFNANKRDWINCIKSRGKPLCDLESGHRTAIICNLGNMSLRLGGRSIQWDPEKEVVIGDKEAAAMCAKQYRAPWDGILRSIIKV